MNAKIHILTRTARAEVMARRELGNFGFTVEAEQNDPGQVDPALRRMGLDADNAALLSSPNLILAAADPLELAEFLRWVKTHPPVLIEEATTPEMEPPAQTAMPAPPALPATPAIPARPAKEPLPATGLAPHENPGKPKTREDLARRIAEATAKKIAERANGHTRRVEHRQVEQGEYTREYGN